MMIAANLMLCLAAPVVVQDYPSPHGVEHVRITRGQFQEHVDSLPLDAVRLDNARALFAGYTGDFEELIKAYKLAWNWSHSTSALPYDARDDELWNRIVDDQDLLEMNWQRSARDLSDAYFDRLESLAPPFGEVIDRHRRDQLVQRALGQLIEYVRSTIFSETGASDLDLAVVAEEHGLVDRSSGAVAEYDRRLLALAEQIDTYIWRHASERRIASRAARDARLNGSTQDLEQALVAYNRSVWSGLQLAWEVRRLNIELAPQIEAQVPEENQARFRYEVERALHPYVFGIAGPVERRINAALVRDDLTDAQKVRLRELSAGFTAERAQQLRAIGPLFERTIDPERLNTRNIAALRIQLFADESEAKQAAHDHATNLQRQREAAQQAFDDAITRWNARLEEFEQQFQAIVGDAGGGR